MAVFLPYSKVDDHPLDSTYYRQSYWELSKAVKEAGGQLLITRDQATYFGAGKFSRGWMLNSPDEITEHSAFTAHVVFNKSNFVATDVPIFNHPELAELCTNKFVMYERLHVHCPTTWLASNTTEYQTALNQVQTDRAVVKPIDGAEGANVLIDVVKQLQNYRPQFPTLVQEYLDTSGGIPGIVEGLHDLRVAIFDGDILYSYVRTPPPGKFTANVAQGGSFFMLSPSKVPSSVVDIVRSIDEKIAHVGPRFYGIDFGITDDGPKIIEMNSRLGLLPNKDAQEFVELKKRLANAFLLLSNNSGNTSLRADSLTPSKSPPR